MSIYNILAKLSALTAGENSAELNKTGATAATANDTLTEAAAKLEKKFRDWEAEDEPKEPTAAELETDKELKAKGKGNAKTLQKIADAYAKKKADESVAEGKIDDLNDLRAAKASGEEWTTSTGGRAVRKGHVTTHHAGKGVYGGDKPYKHGDVDDNDEDNNSKTQAEPAAPKKRGRPKKVREAALAEKAVSREHLNEGLDTIAHRYGKEIRDFAQTGELDENLYHALYDYYFDDMPYGVKKARTADPYEWISDKLDEELRSGELEVKESNIATPNFDMVAEEPIEEAGMAHQIGDWVYSGSVAGEIIDFRGNDHVGPVAIIQSENGEHHAVPVSTITTKKPNMFKRMAHAIVGEDNELNELARLAGLTVAEAKKAKPDFLDVDKDGDKTEPMKKALKDKEVNEASSPSNIKLGKYIEKYFGLIYDFGDNGLEYLDRNAPFWTALYDKHNGNIDAIIANESPAVLKKAALELKGVVGDLKHGFGESVNEGAVPELKAELVEIMPPWDFEVAVYNPRTKQKEHYTMRPNDMWAMQTNRFQIMSADLVDLQTGKSFFVDLEDAPNEHYAHVFDAISALFWNNRELNQKLAGIIKYSQEKQTMHKPLPGVTRPKNVEITADDALGRAQTEKDLMSRLRQGVKENVNECMGSMSPIGSAETQDNISINSNYSSRDNKKTVSVTAEGEQAEALMQMLKMAGMLPTAEAETAMRARIAVAVPQEQEVEVEEAANDEVEYSNSPDEQYQGVDAIVHQGNDLNREKKQYASKPRLGDNPMTEDILTLESKLAAEYESIKKVTK